MSQPQKVLAGCVAGAALLLLVNYEVFPKPRFELQAWVQLCGRLSNWIATATEPTKLSVSPCHFLPVLVCPLVLVSVAQPLSRSHPLA